MKNCNTPAPYLSCSVCSGSRTVIEAAAGTGKTYNITNITARLIMERGDITISNMVIVTFTKAAASELKKRISQRLAELENALRMDQEDELIQLALNTGTSREEIGRRLRLALLNFDQAMIGTIHSFAMRCLSENCFSGKLKFGFTLNENTSSVIQQLCNDFYRSIFYEKPMQILKTLLPAGVVSTYIFKRMANPGISIVWPEETLPRAEADGSSEKEIFCSFAADFLPELAFLFEKREKQEAVVNALKPRSGEKALAKKELDSLDAAIDKKRTLLIRSLCELAFRYVGREYKKICEGKNFLGNDDLILEMEKALYQGNSFLAPVLQEKFRVGLIDEFQDTNDSQFAIFRRIFLENPNSTFIVVGDPRQAIYRFRNGDIQSYINAAREILSSPGAQKFSMNVNHRSGEKYIDALNAVFARPGAFAMENMDMPLQSAPAGAKVLLKPDGKEIEKPIQTAICDCSRSEIYEKCADDIENLLKSQYLIPEDDGANRPVKCEDIAILVNNSWDNAGEIRKILQKRAIPTRLIKNPNVFTTPEAEQFLFFLEGVLDCGNRDALFRALVTPLGDLELADLHSEQLIESRARWMQSLNELWHTRSFMVMYNTLVVKYRLYDRLSGVQGGERSLSNFDTIADILAEEEYTGKLTPGAVLRSFQKHIALAGSDESKLFPGKPETDEGSVVINTIFGSKGLKYPIVFLPDLFYLSKSFNIDKISRTFHLQNTLCYAPLINNTQKLIEHDEMIQENLRKTYVAFTRAQYFCRFYCTHDSSSPCSSIDWLFRDHKITTDFSNIAAQLSDIKSKLPKELSPAGKKVTPPIPWGALIHSLEAEIEPFSSAKEFSTSPTAPLRRRSDLMPGLISQSGFLSFSSVTPHNTSANIFTPEKNDEEEDLEENAYQPPNPLPDEKLPETMFLPSGTNFGNAIHKILELCSYDSDESSLSEIVRRQLKAHGISAETYGSATTRMLLKMLDTPICDGDGGTFKLSEIAPAEKKCEFEFLYEFDRKFSKKVLFEFAEKCFYDHFKVRCPEFTDENANFEQGFFNGSIDLFFRKNGKFYIVDWKTNKLPDMNAYNNENLKYAIAHSRYCLQYMIYTVALFKYLKQRLAGFDSEKELYDRYFGGVRYIFLRGFTDGAKNRGVFSDRLSFEELQRLEEIIG